MAEGAIRITGETYLCLKFWRSGGFLVSYLPFLGQCWDWLARSQYAETGWDSKLDQLLLSPCGSTYTCLGGSVSEIHFVAGASSNQLTNKQTNLCKYQQRNKQTNLCKYQQRNKETQLCKYQSTNQQTNKHIFAKYQRTNPKPQTSI